MGSGPVVLDWHKHKLGARLTCRLCPQKALMRDEQGRPCHKVCAEREAADKASVAAASYERGRAWAPS